MPAANIKIRFFLQPFRSNKIIEIFLFHKHRTRIFVFIKQAFFVIRFYGMRIEIPHQ